MDEVLWRACIQLATGGVQEKLFSFQFTVTHSLHVEEQVILARDLCNVTQNWLDIFSSNNSSPVVLARERLKILVKRHNFS